MASKLSIYNGALLALGDRRLATLTDARDARYALDDAYVDGREHCLEQGYWNFAMRTRQADYSPSVEPPFGYRRAFDKPTDWIRTAAVCEDEFFNAPLTRYADEAAYWYADLDTIYVKYVSSDAAYGLDFAKWPANFTRYVEHYLASRIAMRLTGDQKKKDNISYEAESWLRKAKATDAMDEGAVFPPQGSWSSARQGRYSRRDRGSRSNLIG